MSPLVAAYSQPSPLPGWAITIPLLIVTGLVLWLLVKGNRDYPGIEDVPCTSCMVGYGQPHTCEEPDYCPCDKAGDHRE